MKLFNHPITRRHLFRQGLKGGVAAAATLLGMAGPSSRSCQGALAPSQTEALSCDREQYPVGVVIGELHVCVAVGERLQDGSIKLLSVSHRNASPEKFGISDPYVRSTVACLGETLMEAENSAGVMIKKVALAIAAEQLRQKPCLYFSQDWIEPMLVQDKKDRQSFSNRLEDSESFRRYRKEKWRARGWTEIERRWRNLHCPGSCCEDLCFVCRPDGVIDCHSIEDCLQLEQGTILADLDWWSGWILRGLSEHGVEIEPLIHSAVACAECVLSAAHKERGAVVVQVEESSVSLALYGGRRLLWSDCLHADSYICLGLFDRPSWDEPPPDWHSRLLEDIRDRCSIDIPVDATFHVTGAWATETRMVEMAEAVFTRRVVQSRGNEGVFGRSDWLSDPQYACAIGLLRFA
jgi:hypothetical protein